MDRKFKVTKAVPAKGWVVGQTVTLDEADAGKFGTDLQMLDGNGQPVDTETGRSRRVTGADDEDM